MGIADGPFPQIPEPAIASYDWIDISSGLGIIQFMGAKAAISSTEYEWILTTNSNFYSNGKLGYTALNGFDKTFEAKINKPMTVKGDAFVNIPINVSIETGDRECYVTATIKKSSGGVVTTIGAQVQSETFIEHASTGTMVVLKLPLTQTRFNPEDILQLNITGTASGGTGTPYDFIGHSPIGAQLAGTGYFSAINTRLSLFLPVKIDI